MVEVEHALIAQKEEFQMRMESLQQRTEELDRKEQQLKESLLKFDKFLKENDAKRARAIKKSAEEQELCKKKGTRLFINFRFLNETSKPYQTLIIKLDNQSRFSNTDLIILSRA